MTEQEAHEELIRPKIRPVWLNKPNGTRVVVNIAESEYPEVIVYNGQAYMRSYSEWFGKYRDDDYDVANRTLFVNDDDVSHQNLKV